MGNKSQVRRQLLRERDGDTCCYCGEPMLFMKPFLDHDRSATIEHVLSAANGGTSHLFNLKLAHKACNVAAGVWSFFEKLMVMAWFGHTTEAKPRWAA